MNLSYFFATLDISISLTDALSSGDSFILTSKKTLKDQNSLLLVLDSLANVRNVIVQGGNS